MTGAQNPVTFNDIDSLALNAVALNAQANHLDLNHITLDDTDLLQNVQKYTPTVYFYFPMCVLCFIIPGLRKTLVIGSTFF